MTVSIFLDASIHFIRRRSSRHCVQSLRRIDLSSFSSFSRTGCAARIYKNVGCGRPRAKVAKPAKLSWSPSRRSGSATEQPPSPSKRHIHRSINGRTIERDDPFGRNTIFHSSCRGIWVSILMDEEEKRSIGGIPQSLKDRFGDAVNDLIQPKNPVTRKNPLAHKEAAKHQQSGRG